MTPTLLAVSTLLGLGIGGGLLLVVVSARAARPDLAARVASQVVDLSPRARELVGLRRASGGMATRIAAAARRRLDAVLGGQARTRALLHRAGASIDLEGYRAQQVSWVTCGAAAGALLAVALVLGSGLPPVIAAVLPVASAAAGAVARERLLQLSARRRTDGIGRELPTMLEFLALSLSAGEGIHDGLRRLARVGKGELSREFAAVVSDVGSGRPLAAALDRLARDLAIPELSRAVDQLVSALDRGAPLAEVLRAQAEESRDAARRGLLEAAGRKEIAMLVPLVFLILPFTVLVAVYPGFIALQSGF